MFKTLPTETRFSFSQQLYNHSKAKTPENTGLRNVFFFNVVTFANNKLHVYSVNIS